MTTFWILLAMGRRMGRQPRYIIMTLLLPLLLSMIMGGVYQPDVSGAIPIAWVDDDRSQASQFLTTLMREESMLQLVETDMEEALKLVRRYQVEGVYRIPPGFEALIVEEGIPTIHMTRSAASLGADAVGELIVSGVIRLASHHRGAGVILQEYQRSQQPFHPQDLRDEIIAHAEGYWEGGPLIALEVETNLLASEGAVTPQMTSRGVLAPPYGVLVAMMAFFAASLPILIEQERRGKTWERMALATGKEGSGYRALVILFTCMQSLMAALSLLVLDKGFQLSYWGTKGSTFWILTMYGLLLASFFAWVARWEKASRWSGGMTFGVLLATLLGGCFWTTALYPDVVKHLLMGLPPALAMALVEKSLTGDWWWVVRGMGAWFILIVFLMIPAMQRQNHR